MNKLNNKWLFFSFGILTGILLSGIFVISINYILPESAIRVTQIPVPTKKQPDSSQNHFSDEGKININSATREELMELPGIGSVKASAIIDFREKYGPYEEINELLYVTGIGEAQLNQIIPFIEIP